MKFAVFGATGPTGIEVVRQAIAGNHQVVAVVRNPDKFDPEISANPKLTVVKGNIFDSTTFQSDLVGCDAVLSCLGAPIVRPFGKITLYSESMKQIVAGMRYAKVPRIVVCSSWCTKYNAGQPFWIEWIFKPLLIGRNLDDMARMEDYLAAAKDIQFVSVRPCGLGLGPLSGLPIQTAEGQFVPTATKQSMPRADVAKFMLEQTDSDKWLGKMVAISN